MCTWHLIFIIEINSTACKNVFGKKQNSKKSKITDIQHFSQKAWFLGNFLKSPNLSLILRERPNFLYACLTFRSLKITFSNYGSTNTLRANFQVVAPSAPHRFFLPFMIALKSYNLATGIISIFSRILLLCFLIFVGLWPVQ